MSAGIAVKRNLEVGQYYFCRSPGMSSAADTESRSGVIKIFSINEDPDSSSEFVVGSCLNVENGDYHSLCVLDIEYVNLSIEVTPEDVAAAKQKNRDAFDEVAKAMLCMNEATLAGF